VEDLALRFDVSPQTIRRDLNEMSEARVITRVHGGAIVASGTENLAYEARKLVAQVHKRLIGQAAARLIADKSSLFINIGTTTEEVARALVSRSGLLVITNNLNVALELYRNRGIELILTGGAVRPNDGGIVGAATVDMIRQFRVDTAVIGISGAGTHRQPGRHRHSGNGSPAHPGHRRSVRPACGGGDRNRGTTGSRVIFV
jgi:DeoR family glycerol-3-phosphate regulon repressor